jgi:LuxR family maltose regulon positive regulatory protein
MPAGYRGAIGPHGYTPAHLGQSREISSTLTGMPGPLLETKLYVPRPRRQLVSRPRLLARLDRVPESKLTLISAPAGFGKSTLLTGWIAASPRDNASIAWLSLDEHDNDVGGFWTYFIAALRRAAPEVGAEAEACLQTSGPDAVREALAALINELRSEARDFVVVLDDYHEVHLPAIHEAMTFLLDYLPPSLHIVIASRADPPLPLARLRARGELVELRAADLRFKAEETAAYLNGVMALSLTAPNLDALEGQTEGWIAALQLAALSMQGRDDVTAFIEDFKGDNHYVVDYLIQEVLQRQPEAVRSFLLKTAILDRFTGGLCDAVTGQTDGQARLRSLEEGNVFIVPLDDRREWYRYHHLFADVLRAHLLAEGREKADDLHKRASAWFEQAGDMPVAIRHALAASDFERAAALIERAIPGMLRARQESTVRTWLESLPSEVLSVRPVLGVGYVGVLMQGGEMASVEARLNEIERLLESAPDGLRGHEGAGASPIFVDEDQFREIPGMVALYRAGHAQVTGNLPDTMKFARLAIERLPPEHPLRGGAMALLGLALWSSGDLEAAHQTFAEGIALVHAGGYVNDSSTIMLADMRIGQGRLREALSAYERALQAATEQGTAAPRGTADLHVGISEIYIEQNDLDAARRHLRTSQELGESAGLPENRFRWFIAMAALTQAENDFDGALQLLQQAERLYAAGFSPDLKPIDAIRPRIWLRQGRTTDAIEWCRQQGLPADDDYSYLREFRHLTLVRVLIAQFDGDRDKEQLRAAETILDRVTEAAESGRRTGTVIEALILKAIVQRAAGSAPAALDHLQRALSLAAPEGYARVFVDEGPPVAMLLEQLSNRDPYARRLLAAFGRAATTPQPAQASSDSLSERELEVLRLLASDLSGPDIARALVVSLNTMRTHTKSIYTKLDVNSRRAAVRRAEELRLL